MGEVVLLSVSTSLDINADQTLANLSGKLQGFILAGYDKDGNEFFSSTYGNGGEALWLIERCKMALLSQGDSE